jgi:hypothetical protein
MFFVSESFFLLEKSLTGLVFLKKWKLDLKITRNGDKEVTKQVDYKK